MQTAENIRDISRLKSDICTVESQMSDVMEHLSDVVTRSDLSDMMNNFVDNKDNGWLLFNTKYCSADLAYASIYSQAKKSIFVVDNYIGLRTLVMLKNAPAGVAITLFSDNIGANKLHLRWLIPWVVATFYAVTDELHQFFVPGRNCNALDVVIDSARACVGALVCLGVVHLFGRKKMSS